MSVATQQFRASYAFVERNWNLVRRYWAWELVWLVYSVANSLSVSYIGLGMEVLTGNTGADYSYSHNVSSLPAWFISLSGHCCGTRFSLLMS